MLMKTTRKPLSVLAAALTGCLGIMAGAQAVTLADVQKRGSIRIAVANEIPYGYMDMSGQAKGAGPDVAKAVMERLGIKNISWETANFGSLIPGLQAKRFDMVAAEMAILPPRCQQILFSEPNSSYGEGLLVAKGNPKNIHSYEDFAKTDHKIAIMAGADQLEMMQALGVPDSRMVTISNNADAISTVSTGRADAYAATGLTVNDLAAKSAGKAELAAEFKDPVVNGNPVRSWGGFAFGSDSQDLRDAVNKELAEFKKTDEWKAILTNYGFTDEDVKHSFEKSTEQLCKG